MSYYDILTHPAMMLLHILTIALIWANLKAHGVI